MKRIAAFYSSTVGQKLLIGLTGFFLCSFLIVHLYLNLFLFKQDGGQTFDAYSEFMATYPLIRPLEIVLFAGFLLHIMLSAWFWFANRKVRPSRYAVNRASDNSALSSRIMIVSGVVVLAFLVVHVNTFFVGSRFIHTDRTVYEIVRDAFVDPWYVGFYLVALVFLGYHLRHGFQSAFQTYGLRTGKYRGLIEAVAVLFWLLIPLAFAAIPIYFLWAHSRGGYLP